MTADNREPNTDDPNLKRRSTIVGNLSKGTRASTRIRKQRIVQWHDYSEEEEDDPFADNSDVDSNYSERIGSSRTYAGKEIICGGRNRNNVKRERNRPNSEVGSRNENEKNVKNEAVEEDNIEVSYRVTRSSLTRSMVIPPVRTKVKKPRGKRPVSKKIQLNNLTVSSDETLQHFNSREGQTSIPSLNKNAVTRGTDGTRVETMSHWFSLDKHFKVGKFVMYKRDKPFLYSTKLIIWRIDSKSMLQKYQAFIDEAGTIKFKAVKMYSGWSPLHTEDYVLVPVTVNLDNTKDHSNSGQHIVQIDTSESIDIDSDE